MSTVFTIGADATPFKQAMSQVQSVAKETSEKIGIEGLKGERALHSQISGFFKDISSGAGIAESAMSRLGESFKMSAGTIAAFVAVEFLFDTLKKGYEISEKFKTAVNDSLQINTDNSQKSIAQLEEEVEKLKQQAKDTDLGAMSNLEAGAAVAVEYLTNAKSLTETINDDAREHFEIVEKEREEQDAAASRSIEMENEVLRLKIAGQTAQAEVLQDEQRDEAKLTELERQRNTQAVADLKQQIDLKEQLREKEGSDKSSKMLKEQEDKVRDSINRANTEAGNEERKALFERLSALEKIKFLEEQIAALKKIQTDPNASELMKAQARLEAAKNAAQLDPLKKEQDQKNLKAFQKGNELDSRVGGVQDEKVKAQADLASAQIDAMGFHGQVSSLRRQGFGGGIGPNQNNDQQKAMIQAKDHLKDISKKLDALTGHAGRISVI